MVQDSPDSIRSSGCLLCYSILRVPPTTNVRLLRSPLHCLINWSVSCSQRGDLGRLRARETARGEGAERSPESSYGHYSTMTWAPATLTSDIFSTQLWHVHPCNACANPGEVSGCLPCAQTPNHSRQLPAGACPVIALLERPLTSAPHSFPVPPPAESPAEFQIHPSQHELQSAGGLTTTQLACAPRSLL